MKHGSTGRKVVCTHEWRLTVSSFSNSIFKSQHLRYKQIFEWNITQAKLLSITALRCIYYYRETYMIQKFIRNNACLVYGTLAWNYDRRVTRRTKIKIDRRRRSRLSLFVVEAVGEVDSGITGGPRQAVSYCRRNRCLQKAMYAPANAAVNILIPVTVEGRFVCIYSSSGWDDSCTWRAGVRANARNDGYHIKSMNLAMRRQQSCIQFTLRINTKTGKGST